jgi:hypothetical protein
MSILSKIRLMVIHLCTAYFLKDESQAVLKTTVLHTLWRGHDIVVQHVFLYPYITPKFSNKAINF